MQRNNIHLPSDVWKLILNKLPTYERIIMRNVARFFSKVIRSPHVDSFHEVAKSLPYDIPHRLLTLDKFYISHGVNFPRHNMSMSTFIKHLRDIHDDYVDHGIPMTCDKAFISLYREMKITGTNQEIYNGLQNLHPLMRSILIDIIYMRLRDQVSAKHQVLGGGKKLIAKIVYKLNEYNRNKTFLTPLQAHRLLICDVLQSLLSEKNTLERKITQVNAKLNINLAVSAANLKKVHVLCLSNDCYSNPVLFSQCVNNIDATADMQVTLDGVLDAYQQMTVRARALSLDPDESSSTLSQCVMNAELIPTDEWYQHTLLQEGLDQPNAIDLAQHQMAKRDFFLGYIKKNKKFEKLVNEASLNNFPKWLRNYVFQTSLIPRAELALLKSWKLKHLPLFAFNKKSTLASIFAKRHHIQLFMLNSKITQAKLLSFSGLSIERMLSLYHPDTEKDAICRNSNGESLAFFESPFYQMLLKYNVPNSFIKWVFQMRDDLKPNEACFEERLKVISTKFQSGRYHYSMLEWMEKFESTKDYYLCFVLLRANDPLLSRITKNNLSVWVMIASQLHERIERDKYVQAFIDIYNNDFFNKMQVNNGLCFLLWHVGFTQLVHMSNIPESLASINTFTSTKPVVFRHLMQGLKLNGLGYDLQKFIETGVITRKPELINWILALMTTQLIEKPQYCEALASLISTEELISLTPTHDYQPAMSLDVFSQAVSVEKLADVLKSIKLKANAENISFVECCAKYKASIVLDLQTQLPAVVIAGAVAGMFYHQAESNECDAEPDNKRLKLRNSSDADA